MKFNKKYKVAAEFDNLFSFSSKDDELEHEAKMIMFRFLSEIENLNSEKPIKKKELAVALNTSASYVSQLFQGDKLINLINLAKIQEAFNITFDIKAKPNNENYNTRVENISHSFNIKELNSRSHTPWMSLIKNNNYNDNNKTKYEPVNSLKFA